LSVDRTLKLNFMYALPRLDVNKNSRGGFNLLKNVSIFGSTGFIGSSFSEYYVGRIDEVKRENPNPEYSDILYCIGTTDNYNIYNSPTVDIETNLIKLIKDLEIIRGKFEKPIINYLSSWFVYGKSEKLPFSVEDCCDPRGFYSISKLAAEKILITYCETYNLSYRILRLCNVYGAKDKGVSAKKNALQFLITQIKENEMVKLYNGGNITRDYLDVRDVVRALSLIVNNADLNMIINIGSGLETKIIDVITKAKELYQSKSEIVSITPPHFHQILQNSRAVLDVSYLSSLGFRPKFNIFKELINL
jgi:nucleoside-diphosphate-sugar epimerase